MYCQELKITFLREILSFFNRLSNAYSFQVYFVLLLQESQVIRNLQFCFCSQRYWKKHTQQKKYIFKIKKPRIIKILIPPIYRGQSNLTFLVYCVNRCVWPCSCRNFWFVYNVLIYVNCIMRSEFKCFLLIVSFLSISYMQLHFDCVLDMALFGMLLPLPYS